MPVRLSTCAGALVGPAQNGELLESLIKSTEVTVVARSVDRDHDRDDEQVHRDGRRQSGASHDQRACRRYHHQSDEDRCREAQMHEAEHRRDDHDREEEHDIGDDLLVGGIGPEREGPDREERRDRADDDRRAAQMSGDVAIVERIDVEPAPMPDPDDGKGHQDSRHSHAEPERRVAEVKRERSGVAEERHVEQRELACQRAELRTAYERVLTGNVSEGGNLFEKRHHRFRATRPRKQWPL